MLAHWKLVPHEPTEKQLDAIAGTPFRTLPIGKQVAEQAAYYAVLRDAPIPPKFAPDEIRAAFEKACPQFDMRRGPMGYKDDETSSAFEGFKSAYRSLGL